MDQHSFIYRHIRYYRFVMSLLYKGRYYGRYQAVIGHIEGKSVTELCFGDTVIADHCRKNGILWRGLDINGHFVENATKKGFFAELKDVETAEFPEADVCIISGSLYHFHQNLEPLLAKMLACSALVIISEPVKNLSDDTGIIGKLAKASATVNGREHHFRFTDKTLLEALEKYSGKLQYRIEVKERFSKDRIILLRR